MVHFRLPLFTFFLSLFVGCSSQTSTFNQPFKSEAGVKSEVSEVSVKQIKKDEEGDGKTDIELTWKAPETPVDGFVIRYGDKKDILSNSKRVFITALDIVRDPVQGELYKYRLKNPPQSDPLYISIASFVGDTVSTDSQMMEVKR